MKLRPYPEYKSSGVPWLGKIPQHAAAWIDEAATRIGYEISFTRYFYKPQPLRTLEESRADIEALEKETEGLLGQILVETEGTA